MVPQGLVHHYLVFPREFPVITVAHAQWLHTRGAISLLFPYALLLMVQCIHLVRGAYWCQVQGRAKHRASKYTDFSWELTTNMEEILKILNFGWLSSHTLYTKLTVKYWNYTQNTEKWGCVILKCKKPSWRHWKQGEKPLLLNEYCACFKVGCLWLWLTKVVRLSADNLGDVLQPLISRCGIERLGRGERGN